ELMRKMQNENEQMQQKLSESMRRSTIDSLVQENPTNYTYSNSQIQTNVLRCAHCFAPKSNDLYTRFCTECGLPWQKLTHNPPDNYSVIQNNSIGYDDYPSFEKKKLPNPILLNNS
ncbi:unnamed protein product, partial [Rotaria sp. Silwood1]